MVGGDTLFEANGAQRGNLNPVIVHSITVIKRTPFLAIKLKTCYEMIIKCGTCNREDIGRVCVVCVEKKNQNGNVLRQLCGAAPAADRRTFFIRDSVTAALFCSVSTLDIQLWP